MVWPEVAAASLPGVGCERRASQPFQQMRRTFQLLDLTALAPLALAKKLDLTVIRRCHLVVSLGLVTLHHCRSKPPLVMGIVGQKPALALAGMIDHSQIEIVQMIAGLVRVVKVWPSHWTKYRRDQCG